MSILMHRAVRTAYVTLLAGVFLFAGAQLHAGGEEAAAEEMIHVIGTCPPYDNITCDRDCKVEGHAGGRCGVEGDCACQK